MKSQAREGPAVISLYAPKHPISEQFCTWRLPAGTLREASTLRDCEAAGAEIMLTRNDEFSKNTVSKCRSMERVESHKAGFPPLAPSLEILRGSPHYHGYDYDYHVSEGPQRPPNASKQSHSHPKGLVNHVPGLKRKGCLGTLMPWLSSRDLYHVLRPGSTKE